MAPYNAHSAPPSAAECTLEGMDERGPRQGFGRLVLKALAIASGLTFLTIVMVNACATSAKNNYPAYNAPTKAAPVVSPPPQQATYAPATRSEAVVRPRPLYAPATKSLTVVPPPPLMQLPPEETPQKNAAPQQQGAR